MNNGDNNNDSLSKLEQAAKTIKDVLSPDVLVVGRDMADVRVSGIVGIGDPSAHVDEQPLPPAYDYILVGIPRTPSGLAAGITVLEM